MTKIQLKVINEQGIHARPSTKIATLSLKFEGDVHIIYNDEKFDAKNVMEIMLIGLEKNSIFEISADCGNKNKEIEFLNKLKYLIEVEQFR